jgi:hypothetical protein
MNNIASEKVTVDVLTGRILDYGIVKVEKSTNVVLSLFQEILKIYVNSMS